MLKRLVGDAVRRAVRTFLQAFVGILVVSLQVDALPSPGELASVLAYASWAGVVAVVTFVHNEVEELAPRLDTRASRRSRADG